MSVSGFRVDTRIVNAPGFPWSNINDFRQIPASLSFLQTYTNVRTLSSNAATASQANEGLLYVPRLDSTSACNNASAPYVPVDVTQKSDLPGPNYALVALAPWVSPQCTQEYLAAGRADMARAFVFFLPGRGSSQPPTADDMVWALSDNNRWRTDNSFPIFAISSDTGAALMSASAQYSGNSTSVPNGDQIIANSGTDPRNYVKLYAAIQFTSSPSLPSLWIFLIVVLAVLLAVVGSTSLFMHWLQRRRRVDLRRRIAAGQVELETLGIKRVLVPRHILDKMPVREYEKDEPSTDAQITNPPVAAGREPVDAVKGVFGPTRHLDQPTCAICLDDFVPKESQVRELPCSHIFHPECVDTFLMESSSLCPLCKASSLPRGFCPAEITNVMVRRERLLRQARQRAQRLGLNIDPNQVVDNHGNLTARYRQDVELGERRSRASVTAPNATTGDGDEVRRVGPSPPPAQREERRRWAARRAEAMLGPRAAPTDADDATARVPRLRAAWRRLFPAQ